MLRKICHPLAVLMAGLLAGTPALANPFETTLENGLKVIVKEDRRAPSVVHMLWYGVGSMDEPEGVSGIAHMLEHMMFKGTEKIAPGEFNKRVAAVGGRDNAFTSRDYTAYFQQIPPEHLGEMMMLEADRMANLKIAAAAPDGPLNPRALDAIRQLAGANNPSLVQQVIGAYLADAPRRFAQLRAAADSGDAEGVRQAAHSLKSSSANIGAEQLAALCKELELLGRQGNVDSANTLLAAAETELTRVRAALAAAGPRGECGATLSTSSTS